MAKKITKKNGNIDKIQKIEVLESRVLTLDQIEQKMIELVCNDTSDIVTSMINERKVSMLEKIANLKIKRMQLNMMQTEQVSTKVEPLTIKFINSKTDDQMARLERIDKEIKDQKTIKQDA